MAQPTTAQKEKFFRIIFPTLCLISLLLAALSLIPASRDLIRHLVLVNSRLVLAKAEGDLTGNGMRVAVVKVQTSDSLALEIFENLGNREGLKFVKRLVLPEKRDAYIDFRGNATNLALVDVNGDGKLEIIAPGFDENLVPRLNVFEFDLDRNEFLRMGPETFHL